MLDQITELYHDEEFIVATGLDDAIIGLDEDQMRLIYSVDKCIDILAEDMPYEDAIEYFDFNVCSAYVGEKTPIWCWDNFT